MMWAAGLVPLLLAVALCLGASPVLTSLPPRRAVPAIAGLAVSVALTGGLVVSAIATVSLAQWSGAARAGGWSASVLSRNGALPIWAGCVLAMLIVVLLSRAVVVSGVFARSLITEHRGSTLR